MTLQNPLLPVPAEQPGGNTPAPAAGLTGADVARLRRSLDSSVSDNTRAPYNSAWGSFRTWAQARGTLDMPAAPALAAAYLAHLAEERGLSVSTVRLHKAALAAIHRATGHDDPTNNEGVRRVLQGISRAPGRAQRQARPLTAAARASAKATSNGPRSLGRGGRRQESAERSSWGRFW